MKFLLILSLGSGLSLLAQESTPKNVIVIMADQLRADRLHVYGNPRPTSPFLDRFAAEGTRFTRYYANAPWSAPSQGTVVTGLSPSRHGEVIFAPRRTPAVYPEGTTTLAEAFKAAGYHTGEFSANPVAGRYLTGRGGVDDFDQSNTLNGDARGSAPAMTSRILNWIDQNQDKPFFLYVNYFEPHWPYDPPAGHDLFRNDAYLEVSSAMNIKQFDSPGAYDLTRQGNSGDRKAMERMVQLYDGKIHYLDASLGVLFDQLKQRGLKENTVVLFTSDHGELLYSHVEDWDTPDHRSLYDAAVRVPSIFWGAGVPAGQVVTGLASHVNTANTLLELAGLPPVANGAAPSVAPMLQVGAAPVNQYVFAEQEITQPLRSVRNERFKLILEVQTGRKQLFDTVDDPDELLDISAFYPEVVDQLSGVLSQNRAANEPSLEAVRSRWLGMMQDANYNLTQQIDEIALGGDFHLTGDGWHINSNPTHLNGGAYWTEAKSDDQPLRTALWRADNPMLGRYRVLIHFGSLALGGVATNVPVTVKTRYGTQSFKLNQNSGAGEWQELTVLDDPISVTLTNQADGRVIADAVRFEFIQP